MYTAVALADAWAAPILTKESGTGVRARSIETVVLTRERSTPSLYESMSSTVRRMILGEGRLDKHTTQYLDAQSRVELQGELRRLEQERRANTESPSTPPRSVGVLDVSISKLLKGKESMSMLVKGNPSLVRTTPSRGCLANKAFQLMALAALSITLETSYRSYHPEPRVSQIIYSAWTLDLESTWTGTLDLPPQQCSEHTLLCQPHYCGRNIVKLDVV